MRKLVINIDGSIREFDVETTTVEQLNNLKKYATEFDIIEYKEA